MFARANPLLLVSLGLTLAGCAAISQPEGGPRDTVAPKLVSSSPKSGSTKVAQQVVRLVFSEPVQLKDLSKNLLITPTIPEDNSYKVRAQRNAIELSFAEPLLPNTTYVFNFREAVTDITESNPARDVVVAFSTGAAIDSGAVRGRVQRLLTGLPEGEALIALYPAEDTADIKRSRPFYLTRSDKSGGFELRNLREGRYRIYALLDKNQNSRYDEPERIAYLPEPITIRPAAVDSVRLLTVRPDTRRPLALTRQSGPTQFRVSYGEGIQRAALAPLGKPAPAALAEATVITDKGRTVLLQRSPALQPATYLLSATDSAGNLSVDTLNVRFDGQAPARRGAQYTVVGENQREVARTGPLRLQFTEPIRLAPNKPFGTLVEDSTSRRPLRAPADGSLSPNRLLLTINLNSRAQRSISFIPDSTAISAVSGQSLGLKPLRLRPIDQAATGSISGTVQTKAAAFELQLLDQNYQVVASQNSPRSFRFDNLAPGTYRMRVLIDADKDGRWRGGDPKLRLPPEPVWLLDQPQQVRANWEIENLALSF